MAKKKMLLFIDYDTPRDLYYWNKGWKAGYEEAKKKNGIKFKRVL